MNETLIEQIQADASALDIKITTQEIALYLSERERFKFCVNRKN